MSAARWGVFTALFVYCFAVVTGSSYHFDNSMKIEMRERVKKMFHHGYDNYLRHAFPHDELKPISGSYTDTLAELGNAKHHGRTPYEGVAMTAIDSLDTFVVMNNRTEFARVVHWLAANLSFDLDVRVNIFEANIRLLGGLLAGHTLALNPALNLMDDYHGELLVLAEDLGRRLLPAFTCHSDSAIPSAWVNLKHGVDSRETRETCTAGVGTLLLEFGLLSYFTNDTIFFDVASKALSELWGMRSGIGLFGNTLDGGSKTWRNRNSGIGAGIDSFYEYLFKAYVFFGNSTLFDMFHQSYTSAMHYLRRGPWFIEAHMNSGQPTYLHFNSLQAFWPGLQVLLGDFVHAIETYDAFYSIWRKYGALPERYELNPARLHSTQKYYPLRPEIVESTYFLYRASKNPYYLQVGKEIIESLEKNTKVRYGYASMSDVSTGKLEDHMHSFFLAETCKYLFLLFDEDNFVHKQDNFVFSTEGHIFPLLSAIHDMFGDQADPSHSEHEIREPICATRDQPDWTSPHPGDTVAIPSLVTVKEKKTKGSCLDAGQGAWHPLDWDWDWTAMDEAKRTQAAHVQQTCPAFGASDVVKDFRAQTGDGSFSLVYRDEEILDIKNLGTESVEIVNRRSPLVRVRILDATEGIVQHLVRAHLHKSKDFLSARTCTVPLPRMCPLNPSDRDVLEFEASGELFADPAPLTAALPPTEPHHMKSRVLKRVRAPLVVLSSGCNGELAEDVRGKVVLVDRGHCTFVEKVLRLEDAGCVGVLVANSAHSHSIFSMGGDGTSRPVDTPAMMVSKETGEQLRDLTSRAKFDGVSVDVEMLRFSDEDGGVSALRSAVKKLANGGATSEELSNKARNSLTFPVVEGTPHRFRVVTLGGWACEIKRVANTFHLLLISLDAFLDPL